jgi:hypothetical protein
MFRLKVLGTSLLVVGFALSAYSALAGAGKDKTDEAPKQRKLSESANKSRPCTPPMSWPSWVASKRPRSC